VVATLLILSCLWLMCIVIVTRNRTKMRHLGLHNPVMLYCPVMGLYVEGLDGDSAKRIEDLGFLSLLLL
jgi:hypothetical protein